MLKSLGICNHTRSIQIHLNPAPPPLVLVFETGSHAPQDGLQLTM